MQVPSLASERAETDLPPRHPLVHVAVRSRGLLQVELVETDVLKRFFSNEVTDVAVEMAVVTQSSLEPVQSPLPLLNLRIGAVIVARGSLSPYGEIMDAQLKVLPDVLDCGFVRLRILGHEICDDTTGDGTQQMTVPRNVRADTRYDAPQQNSAIHERHD